MPEGPEARRIAEKLRQKVKGLQLLWIQLYRLDRLTRKNTLCETHTEITTKWPYISSMFPSVCLDVITRGKQIYVFFDNGIVFNSGLGMEGHWYLGEPGGHTDFCLVFGQVQGPLQIEEVRAYYDDQIRYGNFVISDWPTAINKMMTDYGPDFLNVKYPQSDIHSKVRAALPAEFFVVPTVDKFWSELGMQRRSRMALCTFLLNHQEYFSGVGNWILNEVCYYARVHPNRVLGAISRSEAEVIFQAIVYVISLGHETGGLTHGTFLDPDKQTGQYQTVAYKRSVDPNGYPIKQIKMACGRTGYIVEGLQQ